MKMERAASSSTQILLLTTTFQAPNSSVMPPFEDGTMSGLMCEMGTIFWSH